MKNAVTLNFDNPTHRDAVIKRVGQLRGPHRVEIKRVKRQRSLAQNNYLWGVVYPHVADGLEEAWGETVQAEEVHEWLKMKFLSRLIVDHNTGEVKGRAGRSTTDLNVSEFMEYTNQIIKFAAEHLGVVVPTPDESGVVTK